MDKIKINESITFIYKNIRLKQSIAGEEVSRLGRIALEKCGGKLLVVGLEEKPDPCAAAVAYMHTLDAINRGTKIKNYNIRFLMELYGASQVKNLLEKIKKYKWIIIIGSEDCATVAEEIAGRISMGEDADSVIGECDWDRVYGMVEASIEAGLREEY